jgi:hypothetical protein
MSSAFKCDVCNTLFDPQPGQLYELEAYARSANGDDESWSEVHLCITCGEKVLAIIKPALEAFDELVKR